MLVHRHHRPEDLQLPFSSSSNNTFPPSYSLSPKPSNRDSPYFSTDYCHASGPSTPSDQSILSPIPSPYMTTNPSQNPPVRVQSSTPGQTSQPFSGAPSSMPENYSASGVTWDYTGNYHLSPQLHQQHSSPVYRRHNRFPSDSTIGSTGPDSPYTHTQGLTYPYIVDPDSVTGGAQQLEALDGAYSATQYPKSVSAPANFAYDSFFAPAFNNYNPSTYNAESLMATQAAMKQALGQHHGDQNMSGGSPSGKSYGEVYDASMESRNNVPKFSRTMTDVYQDELYQPVTAQPAPVSQPRPVAANQPNLLSPYKNIFSERLQEANQARSASPASSVSRGKSPFRENSEYASDGFSAVASNPHSPATRLNSAARMREQAKAESDAIALAQHQPRSDGLVTPNTISPKEVALDYNETEEDAKMPLFPKESRRKRPKQSTTATIKQEPLLETNSTPKQESSNYASSAASSQPNSTFTFMPPSAPTQYPFMARRQSSIRSTSDQVPDFPSHLTSMESTKSESSQSEPRIFHGLPSSADSSQQSQSSSSPILQRPTNTGAESGTYTCVAQACSARFDTAAKLQKHRREAHPTSPPRTPSTPYAPSSASTNHTPTSATFPNASSSTAPNRNQQSGPHRCERTNPSTGKPCNTVFSRSYDLTRHEDTIHNGRKQKVRCRLCTEEKTFSRNDALTRHMRVVHPEVDFPGKKSRRGG